ncbi:hypothetical protein H072_2456 [Dactylellina haptotyla CBS 200.50]|uniref:Mitochondrial genome maintenance protein MGM101 n=1 Tax=Dactylellina haptotyla (strain CBS 200.50) TaxID=1284197 RepID=S8AL13_DACHA|nr:hypothetical protein H072_2456 [Dactylellina haptotyla CBS 200.50]
MATLRIVAAGMRRLSAQRPLTRSNATSVSSRYTSAITASRRIGTSPPKRQTPATAPTAAAEKPATSRLTSIKDGPIASPDIEFGDEVIGATDWSRSFSGLSQTPFAKEVSDVLLQPLDPAEVEIKPDGIIYLPEIKYRRILNRAFGPGGWGLAPRGETQISEKPNGGGIVTREYALVCHGRLVSVARGEQDYFDEFGIPTAMEACKSNAMMRCCKDLGVASELWDPRFIRKWKKENASELFGEHVVTKKKKKLWVRKGDSLDYPYQASKFGS